MSIYEDHGYDSRQEYLECLADDCGLDFEIVSELAQLLGEQEDFDGLVTQLEDFAEGEF